MSEKTLHIQMNHEEAVQLLWLINRAVNSLQPEKWPMVTYPILKAVEAFIANGPSK
jgi:hypothetical protein